jgi:Tol biopolymer transport system component
MHGMRARIFGVLAFAMIASGCQHPTPSPAQLADEERCSVTDFKTDGSIGGRWNAAAQTLAYSRAAADGHFQAFLASANGENERMLTNVAWPPNRHQFVVDWHPSGKYLFVEVEKANHPGSSTDATPGYGAYTDLWLVTPDGVQAWILFQTPNDYDHAITHGVATPDGTRFTFTERVKAPNVLDLNLAAGGYVFNVADFVDDNTPHLANLVAYQPGDVDQGGEVDGFAGDDATIAFYSTYVTKDLFTSRIYTWNTATGAVYELTHDSFAQAPKYTPAGDRLIYMSGSGADIFPGQVQGADWWSVGLDGSAPRRLTWMNQWNGAHSVNMYRLAGVLSFDSDVSFYGDVMTQPLGLVGKIVKVRCDTFTGQ